MYQVTYTVRGASVPQVSTFAEYNDAAALVNKLYLAGTLANMHYISEEAITEQPGKHVDQERIMRYALTYMVQTTADAPAMRQTVTIESRNFYTARVAADKILHDEDNYGWRFICSVIKRDGRHIDHTRAVDQPSYLHMLRDKLLDGEKGPRTNRLEIERQMSANPQGTARLLSDIFA